MAGNTAKTDIIISIHPKHVANIASRLKDHEFRNYLLPSSVQRMWIYETSPTQAIKYVAQISPGKRPGEITNTRGLNNAAFNEGKLEDSKFAYAILELHATPAPWTLQDLKAKGWLNGPPQKYCYVKESMIDALKGIELVKIFGTTSLPPVEMEETGNSEQAACKAVKGESRLAIKYSPALKANSHSRARSDQSSCNEFNIKAHRYHQEIWEDY
jgi:predicted transcriptional regulator